MTKSISTLELQELRRTRKKFALVNVLSEAEFLKANISGSTNAPIDSPDFLKSIESQTGGDKNQLVVVYCAGLQCDASTRAANRLVEAGYTKVEEYRDGMEVWHSSPNGDRGQHGVSSGDHRDDARGKDSPHGTKMTLAEVAAEKSSGKAVTGS